VEKEQKNIIDFMRSANLPVRSKPTVDVSTSEKFLRCKLILSEVDELVDAIYAGDINGIADGLGDLIYLAKGTGNTFGIDLEDVMEEIHKSNMTKLIGGVETLPSGKIIKRDTFVEPDIDSIIKRQSEC